MIKTFGKYCLIRPVYILARRKKYILHAMIFAKIENVFQRIVH